MNKNNYCAQYLSLQPKTGAYLDILENTFIPAIHPHLMGIVPIFEFQNLKKSRHSDFQEEKKTFWNWVVKDWS